MKSLDTLTFQEVAKMTDDDARTALESIRWPAGVCCPRCGSVDVTAVAGGRSGLYRCKDCRKTKHKDQFTVTVGTIFEDSHIPLSKWLQAFSIVCASKKGVSALQLQRQLQLGSYRSAWHMAHRIRRAMSSGSTGPLGGTVEVDETYVGGKPRNKGAFHQFGRMGRRTRKAPVIALIERGGRIKAFSPQKLGAGRLKSAVPDHIREDATLMTDELPLYRPWGRRFKGGQHRQAQPAGVRPARFGTLDPRQHL